MTNHHDFGLLSQPSETLQILAAFREGAMPLPASKRPRYPLAGNSRHSDGRASRLVRACVRGRSLRGMVIGRQSGRVHERDRAITSQRANVAVLDRRRSSCSACRQIASKPDDRQRDQAGRCDLMSKAS